MKSAAAIALLLLIQLASSQARAADFYVAPDGADTNPGNMAQPFATLERAQMAAAAGDTVYIRGGIYRFSGTQATVGVSFTKSGQSGKPIRYFAFAGEIPIFDLFELKPQERVTGLDVRCNWIHIRGLEVRGVRQIIVGDSWGVRIRGDHNVIEQLNVHDCEAPGIFITSGASNLILNSDSHHNYDPLEDGGNADGFGCHSTGGDNVLRGCRAYENSDDGFDFINAAGTCLAEESWAFRNGFIPDTNTAGANGAGFKSGGFGNPPMTPASGAPRHVIRKNLAFGNRSIGFYANYHPGGIDFLNNTAFDNPANFDMRTPSGVTSSHKLRNNVALMPGRDIVSFNGGTDTNNTWTLQVQVSNADFVSVDQAVGLMPRQADGSLPNLGFLRLVQDSDLIDRGEDVGLKFTGSAPDLGAYEFGETADVGPVDAGLPDAAPAGMDSGTAMSGGTGATATPPVTRMDAGVMQPSQSGMRAPPLTAAGAPGSAAGASASAAGAAASAAGSGTTAEPTEPTMSSDGCGCRVGRPHRMPGAWLVLLLAFGFAVRVRARRRR
jgi:MYXO-CTERM domain-containing protein